MKITSIKARGVGVFRGDVEVPIAELGDAAIVAVTGTNGAGKTTALQLIPGAFYRHAPSRGAIAAMANARDSMIEVGVELAGRRLLSRLLIDGIAKGKPTEGYLFGEDGAPLNDGKVRTYDAEVARLFPSLDVYLASAFAAQGGQGAFLDLAASKRKELFATLLGLGRLQEQSDAAGEKVRAAESEVSSLRARAATLREAAGDGAALGARLDAARDMAAIAVHDREAAERQVAAAQAAVDAWRAAGAELDQAVTRAESAHREAAAAKKTADEAVARERKSLDKVSFESADLAEKLGRRAAHERDAAAGVQAAAARAGVEDELRGLRAAQEQHRAAAAEYRQAMALADQFIAQTGRNLDAAERQADGAGKVPCHGEGAFAACALIARAVESRAMLPNLRDELERANKAQAALLDPGPPPDAARLPALERQREQLIDAAAAGARAEAALSALADAERRQNELDAEAATAREQLRAAETGAKGAGAAVQTAASALEQARRARSNHDDKRPAAGDPREVEQLRRREASAAADVARAEEAIAASERATAALGETETKLTDAVADVDDWRHLQTALGRNGIQALEIDAAGPEVSDLCNELLHACYGSRFSVSLETAALKADGKGTKEVFDLRVLDAERGTDGPADLLSGGEKVLVSEALALAICIYNARRSSIPMEDLFRDEVAGALSSANAVKYIEMLRRALDLGGFHRCYFVAHQPHLWDLADAKLLVADGKVTIATDDDVLTAALAAPEAA